jgi:hypothetical protein
MANRKALFILVRKRMGDDGGWILSVSGFAEQHDPVGVIFGIVPGFSAQQAPRLKVPL